MKHNQNYDIDTVTDEDIEYYQNADLKDGWKTVDEVPLLKALHANKKFQQMYAPRKKSVTTMIDEDVIAWLKRSGRGYQTRLNAILRQAMMDSLAH